MLNKHTTGLGLGVFFALVHAIWSLSIALVPGFVQKTLDWIFALHFLEPIAVITSFNFVSALMLVIVTFIVGYIIGWVFAWTYNISEKTQKKRK